MVLLQKLGRKTDGLLLCGLRPVSFFYVSFLRTAGDVLYYNENMGTTAALCLQALPSNNDVINTKVNLREYHYPQSKVTLTFTLYILEEERDKRCQITTLLSCQRFIAGYSCIVVNLCLCGLSCCCCC